MKMSGGSVRIWLICMSAILMSMAGLCQARNERTFTLAELAKNNGQGGAPAYVAVNGVVYDVTKVSAWAGGRHYCAQAVAGKDITFLWNLVPPSHKKPDFLSRFPAVGKLVNAPSKPLHTNSAAPGGNPAAAKLSLWLTLIIGLGTALVITIVWLLFSLRRKRLR